MIFCFPLSCGADWGDDNGWTERVGVKISNAAAARTDYQVLVTFDSRGLIAEGKMQSLGQDIRFLDSDDSTLLSYWVETDTINTAATRIWVKIPSVPSGEKTIFLYYGSPAAPAAGSGESTFVKFVNFQTDGVLSYGGAAQDVQPANYEILDGGYTLRMHGNNWKASNAALNVSSGKKLDFDFKSAGTQAEINGIGFDTERNTLSPEWFYKCLGTQAWGSYATSPVYSGSGGWERLGMTLGSFSGNFSYLFFCNDADAGQATNIYYRNVRMRAYASPEPISEVLFPVSQVAFTTSAQAIYTDRPSAAMSIETRDASGAQRNVEADAVIALSSSSSGGRFSLTSTPFSSVSSITISAGSASASFYYRDSAAGSPVITAAESPDQGWSDAAQSVEVASPGEYSVAVEITGSAPSTDCQVLVTFNTQALIAAGHMKADGSDIRFFDSDDAAELSYWIEPDTMNSSSTRIWVRVPEVPSGTKNLYLHYGNPDADPKTSGEKTFIEFIDFNSDGVLSYGGAAQDVQPANYEILDGGYTLRMHGNNWKASNISLSMNNAMVLDFDFKSAGAQAEINGIGFDTERNTLSPEWFYKCLGTQAWGSYATSPVYSGSGEWERLGMALDDFTGSYSCLVFSNDADASQATNVCYRNVRIRKACGGAVASDAKFPITKLAFTTSAQSIFEDRASSAITVQAQDIGGAGRSVSANTVITLSSTSSTGRFSLNKTPFQPVTSVTIPAGQSFASFYYRDSASGSFLLTAAESPSQGWTDAAQAITVNPVSVDWNYRVPVLIQNTCGSLSDYQVLVTLNTSSLLGAGKMQADGDDLRFFDSDDETPLSYWIETDTMNGAATRIWVKVPSVPLGSKTIYLYYGNSLSAGVSSGPDTFLEFIDFNSDGVLSYGGAGQDIQPAQYEILDGGYTLRMFGNNWKASSSSQTLNGTTRLDFGFRSAGALGEINGIGFETETAGLSPEWFYKCLGSQAWGSNTTTPLYTGAGSWQTLSLSLDRFGGSFSYLVFCNDADASQATNVYYRDVRVRKYCVPEPAALLGEEQPLITHLIITTPPQTLLQDEASSIITLQTRDRNNSPANVTRDTTILLSSTSLGGQFSLNALPWSGVSEITIPAGENTISFYYRDSVAGSPTLTAREYPSMGWLDAAQQFIILSRLDYFTVFAQTPQTAGKVFEIVVTARDSQGKTVETFAGSVDLQAEYINPDTGSKAVLPQTATGFVNGVLTVECRYDDCGTIAITATDASDENHTGTSGPLLFQPFSFSALTESLQVVGKPFSLNIAALNALGETAPNYTGTVRLGAIPVFPSSPAGAVLSPGLASGFSAGSSLAAGVMYNRWGTIRITVSDILDPFRSGETPDIMFIPQDFLLQASTPPPSRAFYYKDEAFTVTVSARDFSGQTIPNYGGSIVFESLPEVTGFFPYTFLSSDAGQHVFEAVCSEEKTFQVQAGDRDYPQASGISSEIGVIDGKIVVLSASGPVGEISVIVQLVDSSGEIIVSDDATQFTVALEESADNGTSSAEEENAPAQVKQGTAVMRLFDTEAETVRVVPKSQPELEPVPGEVIFGGIGDQGIRILLWKEKDD